MKKHPVLHLLFKVCSYMKKILALVLTLVLCLSTGALVAYAAENNSPVDTSDVSTPMVAKNNIGGEISSCGACDTEVGAEGVNNGAATRNVNKSETITLAKGASKTYSFDVSGGWFNPDHNTVSVVIENVSGGSYQYISENVTDNIELANTTYSGDANRTLSNLNPDDTYEITIINLESDPITLTVSLTSYID